MEHNEWAANRGKQRTDRLNPGTVWKHYANGKLYQIDKVIWDSERDVEVVYHHNTEDGKEYVRTPKNFLDSALDKAGNTVPRFTFWDTAHGMSGED